MSHEVDTLCDRIGGDLLLKITYHDGSQVTTYSHGAKYFARQIERRGGTISTNGLIFNLASIGSNYSLARAWCELEFYSFRNARVAIVPGNSSKWPLAGGEVWERRVNMWAYHMVTKLTDKEVRSAFGPNELEELYPSGWTKEDARFQLITAYVQQRKWPLVYEIDVGDERNTERLEISWGTMLRDLDAPPHLEQGTCNEHEIVRDWCFRKHYNLVRWNIM